MDPCLLLASQGYGCPFLYDYECAHLNDCEFAHLYDYECAAETSNVRPNFSDASFLFFLNTFF